MSLQDWTLSNSMGHKIKVSQEDYTTYSYTLDIEGILIKFESGFSNVGSAL